MRFNAALGLAGVKDRDLVAEVAKSEASLVRHSIGLRRLVLRYVKALLMFIVTALVTFLLAGLVKDFQHWSHLVMAVGYLVWAVVTPLAVRLPVRRWIYEKSDSRSENVVRHDSQLVALRTLFSRCVPLPASPLRWDWRLFYWGTNPPRVRLQISRRAINHAGSSYAGRGGSLRQGTLCHGLASSCLFGCFSTTQYVGMGSWLNGLERSVPPRIC